MSRKSKQKLMNPGRRQALAMISAATATAMSVDPVSILVNALVDGVMNKAQADTFSKPPRNYLYIAFPYGAARWHWDLPLCPYSDLGNANYTYPFVNGNLGISNRFQGNTLTPEYGTTVVTAPNSKVKMRMPHIWSWTIPTVGGTWVPMANLLDNMIMIRGIVSLDGHTDSRNIQLMPKAGAPSIDGAVTDRSSKPVPSIALKDSANIYASAKGIGNIRVEDLSTNYNPLKQILSPFDRSNDGLTAQYLSRRDAMDVVMKRALDALGAAAKSRNPGAELLWNNRSTAEAMIKQGVGNVSAVYSTLLTKYKNLVSQCVTAHTGATAAGVMDRDLHWNLFDPKLINGHGAFVDNATAYFNAAQTNLGNLPESLAIAEYLFTNGYTSAISAACVGVTGLQRSGYATYGWDEHFNGAALSTIVNSFAFRAVAACMYEFTSVLKTAGVFDETVIHMGGEFSRAPRVDGTGSDHSPYGSAISILSGAIKQPAVLGNTQPGPTANYAGNYGVGDTMNLDGGSRQPTVGNQASTMAAILRVASPSPNDASMLVDSSSGIVPAVDLAKNKGES